MARPFDRTFNKDRLRSCVLIDATAQFSPLWRERGAPLLLSVQVNFPSVPHDSFRRRRGARDSAPTPRSALLLPFDRQRLGPRRSSNAGTIGGTRPAATAGPIQRFVASSTASTAAVSALSLTSQLPVSTTCSRP